MGTGYCQFETSHLYHLVQSITSDEYYRSATTLCGKEVDEGSMAVEIYPTDDMHEDYLFLRTVYARGVLLNILVLADSHQSYTASFIC